MSEKQTYILLGEMRFDNRISASAKLLYGEIQLRCRKEGYCWATNAHFANLYDVSVSSVKRWMNELLRYGYISQDLEIVKGKTIRKIRLNHVPEQGFKNEPPAQICTGQGFKNEPGQGFKNGPLNNTSINNNNNNNNKDGKENESVVVVPSDSGISNATMCVEGRYQKDREKTQTEAVQRSSEAGQSMGDANAAKKSDSFLPFRNEPSNEQTNNNRGSEATDLVNIPEPLTPTEQKVVDVLVKSYGVVRSRAVIDIRNYGLKRVVLAARYAWEYRAGKANLAGFLEYCVKNSLELSPEKMAEMKARSEAAKAEAEAEARRQAKREAEWDAMIREQREHEAAEAAKAAKGAE